ncbi:hypothetical protein [Streptomyces albogriseolus]|uniref:hypothetical protein n=1 Tax=Streptomyces albogriseolus TaxID=1887 RepID=UPI0033A9FB37
MQSTLTRRSLRSALVALSAAAVLSGTAASAEAAPAKYRTHAEAAAQLKKAGISTSSSGGCTNRRKSNCTSLERVNKATVAGIVSFKKAGGCAVRVTGGTEVGHASGTYSHHNGYKVDIALNSCVNKYIAGRFRYLGKRGDGALQYRSPGGNTYAREGNHWDITYHHGRV